MSMPEFPKPDPDLTQEQALTMILSSIALEEAALSHIINAEGEKIQYILKQASCGHYPADLKDTLAVNQSVTNLLEIILQNQMILKNKMDKVLEYLPKPRCPPAPPCLPAPPCPPALPCMPEGCRPFSQAGFGVIPKTYCCNEPLQWKKNSTWGHFSLAPGDCSKIELPRTGSFVVGLFMDIGNLKCSCAELEMTIFCQDKVPIMKKIHLNPCHNSNILYKEFIAKMPCSCSACYASVLVCAPYGIDVRDGTIVFSKA